MAGDLADLGGPAGLVEDFEGFDTGNGEELDGVDEVEEMEEVGKVGEVGKLGETRWVTWFELENLEGFEDSVESENLAGVVGFFDFLGFFDLVGLVASSASLTGCSFGGIGECSDTLVRIGGYGPISSRAGSMINFELDILKNQEIKELKGNWTHGILERWWGYRRSRDAEN